MKTKITQFIPIILALAAIGFSYFSDWCIFANGTCYGTVISHISLSVTQPFFYFFAIYFLPIAIVVIFVPRRVFNSWLKFAAWAIPLAIIFIALTPVNSNAFMDFFPFFRDDAARLSGELFAAASLILIIWKWIVLLRHEKHI
jgi:hypothetical protein